jgi:protein TonB
MPRVFLEYLIESAPSRRDVRRASVMPLSLALHAGGLSGLLVLPLLATDALPAVPATRMSHSVPYVQVAPPRAPRRPASPPATGSPSARAPAPAAVRFVAPMQTPPAIEPDPGADFLGELGDDPAAAPGIGVIGGFPGGTAGGDGPATGPGSGDGAPVVVGGDIRPPRKVHHVDPAYPELARRARVEGVVILRCTLSEQGLVTGLEVLRSPPFLAGAATAAVSRWRYEPTHLNGRPVPVVMTVTVTFMLR